MGPGAPLAGRLDLALALGHKPAFPPAAVWAGGGGGSQSHFPGLWLFVHNRNLWGGRAGLRQRLREFVLRPGGGVSAGVII